jgi:hypothetical protein
MRSLKVALALGLGTFASVLSAQVPQKLPPSVTVDTVNAVTVENRRTVPVWVFLEYGKFDRRLGLVEPGKTTTLRLPAWAYQGVQSARFYVRPEGEVSDFQTQYFNIPRAAQLTLTVPSRADMISPKDTMMQVIAPEELDEATITVDNPRDVAVTVFAQQGPFYVQLGRVHAKGRETLRFPKSVLSPTRQINLVLHPDGGVDLATETRTVVRGQHLGVRVPPK